MRKIIEVIPVEKSVTMALLEDGKVVVGWVDDMDELFQWRYELPGVPDALITESEFKNPRQTPGDTAKTQVQFKTIGTLHDAKKT